jgi:pilus assembly protein CpaB
MKLKTLLLMVVAVGCGLAASYMTSRLLADRGQKSDENKIAVVVAKQRVSPYVQIKDPEKYFALKEVPEGAAPKRAIKTLEEIKDQRLGKPMAEDEYLTTDHILNKDMLGLEAELPKGMRAVSIKVNPESVVSGFVRPNSRVDVMFTTRGGNADTANAQVILQNMLVLAVDQTAQRDPNQPAIMSSTVTVAAKPEEAQRLSLAASLGDLRLTLRAAGDNERIRMPAAKYGDLAKQLRDGTPVDEPQAAAPAPVPALPPLPPPAPPAPTKKEEVAVVKEEPPPEKHVMIIQDGQDTRKVVYLKDPEEGWKTSTLGDEPPPRRQEPPTAGGGRRARP